MSNLTSLSGLLGFFIQKRLRLKLLKLLLAHVYVSFTVSASGLGVRQAVHAIRDTKKLSCDFPQQKRICQLNNVDPLNLVA